jgi:hypothetical protein
VDVGGASKAAKSARAPTTIRPTSVRRNDRAEPTVAAAYRACAGVSAISRTARAITDGIENEWQVPGLQSVASATRTPGARDHLSPGVAP